MDAPQREKRLKLWAWLVGLGVSGAAFLFGTFATTQYVDAKHTGVMDHILDLKVETRDNKIMLFDMSRALGIQPQIRRPRRLNRDIPRKGRSKSANVSGSRGRD